MADPLERKYAKLLEPLFQLNDLDLLQFIFCFLRIKKEDHFGWDPLYESRQILEDLIALNKANLEQLDLENSEKTHLRLHLLSYVQLIEMNAPYSLLMNLLRLRNKQDYSANPFAENDITVRSKRPSAAQNKSPLRKTLPTSQSKISEICILAQKVGFQKFQTLFDDFFILPLRNAIAHADYVLTNNEIRLVGHRVRLANNPHLYVSQLTFDELSDIIGKCYEFYSVFFLLESFTRKTLGTLAGKPIQYDDKFKTILEISADTSGFINGFITHWPNGREAYYLIDNDKIKSKNIEFNTKGDIILNCGKQFNPYTFSPLITKNGTPKYSKPHFCSNPLKWLG